MKEDYSDLNFRPPSEFDCTKCGACCAHTNGDEDKHSHMLHGRHYVELLEGDVVNLGLHIEGPNGHLVESKRGNSPGTANLFLRVVNNDKNRLYEETRCPFLAGEVGLWAQCGVYERRPFACRVFKPGEQLCIEARKRHFMSGNAGIRPFSTKRPPTRYLAAEKGSVEVEGGMVEDR